MINLEIDTEHILSIGNYVYADIPKAYNKGISELIARNKLAIKAAVISNDDEGRNFFKVDYSAKDLQALQNFKVEAFTVAGVNSYRLNEDIKQLAVDVWQNKEQNLALFEKLAREKMLEYLPVDNLPPGNQLKANWNTGLAGAYNGAEFIRLQDPALQKVYPGYKYMTRNDSRVRAEHAELHGKIFRADDKIWLIIYPPNGWNCRCFVIQLDYNEFGTLRADDENNMTSITDERRKELVNNAGIDSDFARNPGAVKSIWSKWINTQLKEVDYDKVFSAMTSYANLHKADDIEISSGFLQEVKDANKKLGNDSPRLTKDVKNDLLILNLPKELQKPVGDVIRKPSEVWGKTKWSNGEQNSEVYYLQYTKEGVIAVTSYNGEIVSIENVSPETADKKFRRGTIIYHPFFNK